MATEISVTRINIATIRSIMMTPCIIALALTDPMISSMCSDTNRTSAVPIADSFSTRLMNSTIPCAPNFCLALETTEMRDIFGRILSGVTTKLRCAMTLISVAAAGNSRMARNDTTTLNIMPPATQLPPGPRMRPVSRSGSDRKSVSACAPLLTAYAPPPMTASSSPR